MENQKFFASANTNKGFVNKFDNILDYSRDNFRYVIKGGSGTGKSSLMKKVAEYFKGKGESVEYFYCSSDKDSLDGIRLVSRNIAIVDGTAPHVTEAEVPGVCDKIINVGEFISNDVKKYKDEILKLIKTKKHIYSDIYKIISAIGEIKEQFSNIRDDVIKDNLEILKTIGLKKGINKKRELFINAFYEEGIYSFEEQYKNKVSLTVTSVEFNIIIKKFIDILDALDVNYIKFLDITQVDRIYAVYIEDSDIFVKCNEKESDLILGLYNMIGKKIKEVKKLHRELESYYIKSMNFNGLNNTTQKLITEIDNL